MGQRFVAWSEGQIWTPWGSVFFDIGGATRRALGRIERGGTHAGIRRLRPSCKDWNDTHCVRTCARRRELG